jgi:hypothetical protein
MNDTPPAPGGDREYACRRMRSLGYPPVAGQNRDGKP